MDPLSTMILEDLFLQYVWTRQWSQALSMFQRLTALYPNDPDALQWTPILYEGLGRHEEALAAVEKLRASPERLANGEFVVISLTKMGKRTEAEKVLVGLKDAEKKERFPDYVMMAYPRFALGDREQGFAYLDQAYQARDKGFNRGDLAFMNAVWALEDWHRDPRYTALLKKMGNPAAQMN